MLQLASTGIIYNILTAHCRTLWEGGGEASLGKQLYPQNWLQVAYFVAGYLMCSTKVTSCTSSYLRQLSGIVG